MILRIDVDDVLFASRRVFEQDRYGDQLVDI
jgi:hypothetical protein